MPKHRSLQTDTKAKFKQRSWIFLRVQRQTKGKKLQMICSQKLDSTVSQYSQKWNSCSCRLCEKIGVKKKYCDGHWNYDMKERDLWDNPEKDGSAGYLRHQEQRKELRKNQERKNGEERRDWRILVTQLASNINSRSTELKHTKTVTYLKSNAVVSPAALHVGFWGQSHGSLVNCHHA